MQVTEVKKIKPNAGNIEKTGNEFGEKSRFSQAVERNKCFPFPAVSLKCFWVDENEQVSNVDGNGMTQQ